MMHVWSRFGPPCVWLGLSCELVNLYRWYVCIRVVVFMEIIPPTKSNSGRGLCKMKTALSCSRPLSKTKADQRRLKLGGWMD